MFKSIVRDSLTAELWALILGLRMSWESGFSLVSVKFDSLEVIRLMRKHLCISSLHHEYDLINQAKEWLEKSWETEVKHIPRNMNIVEDTLVK